MDYRWALLLQTFFGHKFTSDQIDRLLDSQIDPLDLPTVLNAVAGHALTKCPRSWIDVAERTLERSDLDGVRWSYPGCRDYPELWNELSWGRPLIFSYQGEPVWRHLYSISVVGSRNPARETCLWMQRELTRFLRDSEFFIVSGGARGVDQWAHRISVDMARPTVCIFPSGLLRPYPYDGRNLYDKILETGGALVSTFGLEQEMRRHLFVIRNRWIAGLSGLTFIVEANRRSGTSLTAKLALDEDRELCTLPMSALSETGLGNLDLLAEDKAVMVRNAVDLIKEARNSKSFWSGPCTLQRSERHR